MIDYEIIDTELLQRYIHCSYVFVIAIDCKKINIKLLQSGTARGMGPVSLNKRNE